MTPAQDVESYFWPPLTPAAWLEDQLSFCRCGSLLTDLYLTRVKCCHQCLGAAAA